MPPYCRLATATDETATFIKPQKLSIMTMAIKTRNLTEAEFEIMIMLCDDRNVRYELDQHWRLTNNLIEVPERYMRVFNDAGEVVEIVYCNN